LTRAVSIIAMMVIVVVAHPVRAAMSDQQRRAVLDKATRAYDSGASLIRSQPDRAMASFEEAIEGYESLIADGVRNGRLYYNLGNAYLQVGHVGKAIVNYRRAKRLLYGDPQLEHNLDYARSLRSDKIAAAGERAFLRTAFFWHYNTSTAARLAVAVGAYVVFWLMLIAGMLTRASGWRVAALVVLPIWLAAGASVTTDLVHRATVREGVTTSSKIVVRKGNGEGYEPQFAEQLHEGVEFVVIDQRPGWYKIELPDGSSGWIKRGQAELI